MSAETDFDWLLRAGSVFYVHSEHWDAEDAYEFRLRADGARDLDCALPDLPKQAFRAVFTTQALSKGEALLAVTQTNPHARNFAAPGNQARRQRILNLREDGHGGARLRRYTFRHTTPPFLLSEKLARLVREKKPVALHFYDYMDDCRATELAFKAERNGKIKINGKSHKVRIVRYEMDDFALEVLAGTRLVRLISRMDGEIRMELLEVRVPRVRRSGRRARSARPGQRRR